MMQIPFTQYVRPHGEKQLTLAPCPEGYEGHVKAILEHGWEFNCEVLSDGSVALYVSDNETDHVVELSPNGPEIDDHLKSLLDRGYKYAEGEVG